MNKVKIISLGYANPDFCYTQEQVFHCLGYPQHFWRLFNPANCGVETRHFAVPLEKFRYFSFQEQQDEYRQLAPQLAKRAILNCLDGRDITQVKSLFTSSCTGYLLGPVMGHYLAREFNLKDIEITNISGQGCDGCLPGFRGAWHYTALTGDLALAVTTELCSLTYYPELNNKPDQTNKFELARGYSIFGDAAAAVLLGYDNNPCHPVVMASRTVLDTTYMSELGYTWQNGRPRLLLSPKVADIAPELAEWAVADLMTACSLHKDDVQHWVIHAAGLGILEDIKRRLGLRDEQVALSKQVLRKMGNCSSATIGIIGKSLMGQKNLAGNCLMVTIGPGMQSDCTWLKFGDEGD